MTQEEIDEINREYEVQLKEDYDEYIKERFVGIELLNNYDRQRIHTLCSN